MSRISAEKAINFALSLESKDLAWDFLVAYGRKDWPTVKEYLEKKLFIRMQDYLENHEFIEEWDLQVYVRTKVENHEVLPTIEKLIRKGLIEIVYRGEGMGHIRYQSNLYKGPLIG